MHFIWKSRSQSQEKEWRGTESKLLEVDYKGSSVSDDLGCNAISWCFINSRVNIAVYLEILAHVMLLSIDNLYGDSDILFQQALAPGHSANTTGNCFTDHGITVLD